LHFELLFPSLFLKAADLAGKDVTLTVRHIQMDELQIAGTSKKKNKAVMYFTETEAKAKKEGKEEKRLVLNRTNAEIIAKIHGKDTDLWIGKKITLYPTKTDFGNKRVDCIRVRD